MEENLKEILKFIDEAEKDRVIEENTKDALVDYAKWCSTHKAK